MGTWSLSLPTCLAWRIGSHIMLKKIILQCYQMYAIGPYLYIIPYYALKKSNHLLTLYNITIIIPIFCYTEA